MVSIYFSYFIFLLSNIWHKICPFFFRYWAWSFDLDDKWTTTVPKVFAIVFNIVKRFLDEYTLSKILIFKQDSKKWLPKMLEHVDPTQLPKYFGGTETDEDGDPRCMHKVRIFLICSELGSYRHARNVARTSIQPKFRRHLAVLACDTLVFFFYFYLNRSIGVERFPRKCM